MGDPVQFYCNTVGASAFQWDFNGEGTNFSSCNPAFTFSAPGTKKITLKLTLANGQPCNFTYFLNIKSKPVIRTARVSKQVQCYLANTFCFVDSTVAPDPADTLTTITFNMGDGAMYRFTGNKPKAFCHTYSDPAGGIYTVTIEAVDQNGCISKKTLNSIARTLPSLGLQFTSPRPQKCDSVLLCVTNNSAVLLDSIKTFTWEWGDSSITSGNKSTPSLWKPQVCHWFKKQGPKGGTFDTKLTVTTNFGCTETYTFFTSATNILTQATILADMDSVCAANPVISFRLKDGPVVGGANPLFVFEQPLVPTNITRDWKGSHKFSGPGVYKIVFSFTHAIPGCARNAYDTILVVGPQSVIEGPSFSGMNFIADSLRYQCVIRDTVRFTNFSKFYHNDRNMLNDDSTYTDINGFNKPIGHKFVAPNSTVSLNANPQKRGNGNIQRIWDFDDDYCERCTTDTRKGLNVGRNCRFSKDSIPQHWYTPWEELYLYRYGAHPEKLPVYNKDSGTYQFRNLWSDDSAAIVRDTTLYYGDNALAKITKDSVAYSSITKKIKVAREIRGISRTDFTHRTVFYLEAGDTAYIDLNLGAPPSRYIGQRYLIVLPGQSLVINASTDKALYNVWLETRQDTIPMYLVNGSHKIWKRIVANGYKSGDSVNYAAHRQRFYEGPDVRCFNVRLSQKDIVHPLACSSEVTASLSLQPPNARHLRKTGIQCFGGELDQYGITFILDETKPGCSRTWAEINLDTAKDKNAWIKAIGKNLGAGALSAGGLPPLASPYPGIQAGGFAGPTPNKFSTQYNSGMIKDTVNGYIDVGLVVGNGLWPGGNYPEECQDTVYYPKFARFPILDNKFRIVKAKEGAEFTRICKRDTLRLSLMPSNNTDVSDVRTAVWSLSTNYGGKYFDRDYSVSVVERYERFVEIHPDTPYLVDQLQVVRYKALDKTITRLDSQVYRIAKVTAWHREADISAVFEQVKMMLAARGININDLSPQQMADIIWNGKGTIGKAYTGSRGVLDTTGFGKQIIFKSVADSKQTLHFRDTSLLPVEKARGWDGKIYNAYSLVPEYAGMFTANFALQSRQSSICGKVLGNSKKVMVGFYGTMNFSDTILCHGQQVLASPQFRYFEVYPEITFRLTDPVDYWRSRIQEAGNPNRESYTVTDLNKADDDKSNPQSMFGGWPYSITGLDNQPNEILRLSSSLNSLGYYDKDTGASYIIRTTTADSFGCRDTLQQEIYLTAARAKAKLDQARPQCKTIITLYDSSYVIDPHKVKYGLSSDQIIKWTVYWGDHSHNASVTFFNTFPANVTHTYSGNGNYKIVLMVETQLGCVDYDTVNIYIPGPVPFFDTAIPRRYCVGDKVEFSNLSHYLRRDSSSWIWSFGDNVFSNQGLPLTDTITAAGDTMNHRYMDTGRYNVFLYQTSRFKVGTVTKICAVSYPDTSNGEPLFVVEIIACDSTGIRELSLKELRMYPNPAHNALTIHSLEKVEILIIDAMGKTVRTFMTEGEQTTDLKNLSPGLYIVTTRNRQVLGKLIIE